MFSPLFIQQHHSLADLRTTQVHVCVGMRFWTVEHMTELNTGAIRRLIECSVLLHSPKKDKKEN